MGPELRRVRIRPAADIDLLPGERVLVQTSRGDEHVFSTYATYASLEDAVADGALRLRA